MSELLHWITEPPALREPVMIMALDGFVDAGAAASTASMFLRHRWTAEVIAELDGDVLFDYRARRPTAVVDGGVIRRVEWPELEVLAAFLSGPRDAVLLVGPEPDTRWHAFAECVIELCTKLGVTQFVQLGAYPAATPHTRPISVTRARNRVPGGLEPEASDVVSYTGPVNIATVVQAQLADGGIPAVGLWAEVPHYIAATPHPPAALALVHRISRMLDVTVDTTELEAAAKLHLEQIQEAVAEHDEAASMVTALEQMIDSGGDAQDLPSGDDLAAEIERFLQARHDD